MNPDENWKVFNPSGSLRILVTRELPGNEWLHILTSAGYRVDMWCGKQALPEEKLAEVLGKGCAGIIGQLTEKWNEEKFGLLSQYGGRAYSNYAVGFDNVDIDAATRLGIGVGNTPGVLTETTAEMAVALTMACARRIAEADRYTRSGTFTGWLPDLLLGKRLWKTTLGIIGAGRIGSAYASMMVSAFRMDLVYLDNKRNTKLEEELGLFNESLAGSGQAKIKILRAASVEEVLVKADVLSLHVPMKEANRHMIDAGRLAMMKHDAILINTSRGPVVCESDLARHLQNNKEFCAGLDVYEFEPVVNELLIELDNVVLAPHIASATRWTRENMAKLAALNIKGILENYPPWDQAGTEPFLAGTPPKAIPGILNPGVLKGQG